MAMAESNWSSLVCSSNRSNQLVILLRGSPDHVCVQYLLKENISSMRKSQFHLRCLTLLLHWNAELLHWRKRTTNSLQSLWESRRSLEYLNVSLNSQHTHFLAHILIVLKDGPYIGLLILLNLSPTWSQNMIIVLSLEQMMRHLRMPLKALLSMHFFYFRFGQVWIYYRLLWREEYTYRSFKKLVHWCPSIKKTLGLDPDNHDIVLAFQEVRLSTILWKPFSIWWHFWS